MRKKIERLLKILELIETANIRIDVLKSNIRMYPKEFVHLIDEDNRSITSKEMAIERLEDRFSKLSQSLSI